MGEYKNVEYLKKIIIYESRHHFIYCENNKQRELFLKELELDKESVNLLEPIVVYLDNFGLPKIDLIDRNKNSNKFDIICREYLFLSIIYKILTNLSIYIVGDKAEKLLNFINKLYKNAGFDDINSIDELIKEFEKSLYFYSEYYQNIALDLVPDKTINDIRIPFIELESFISYFKRIMNISTNFVILVDKKEELSDSSIKVVNLLIGSRINKDIAVKVFVSPGEWNNFITLNDQFVEYVHDYGIVELDNSYKAYIRKLKQQ